MEYNTKILDDGKCQHPHNMIEFYDADYVDQENPLGQFVSRYYTKTLLNAQTRLEKYGLDLQGDVPKWKLTPDQMKQVFNSIQENQCNTNS